MKSIKTLALGALAILTLCPALIAKTPEVTPAADLNATEQQLVGKWQNKTSHNMDGAIMNMKVTQNYKADRSYTVTMEQKVTFPMGDADNNSIFVTATIDATGTWSATETQLFDTTNAESVKSSVSVNCTDQTIPGIDQFIEQLQQQFEMSVEQLKGTLNEPDTTEITSLVLKTLVLSSEGPNGEKESMTFKRVK